MRSCMGYQFGWIVSRNHIWRISLRAGIGVEATLFMVLGPIPYDRWLSPSLPWAQWEWQEVFHTHYDTWRWRPRSSIFHDWKLSLCDFSPGTLHNQHIWVPWFCFRALYSLYDRSEWFGKIIHSIFTPLGTEAFVYLQVFIYMHIFQIVRWWKRPCKILTLNGQSSFAHSSTKESRRFT